MKYKSFLILISMFLVVLQSKAQTEQYCVRYPYNTQMGINLNLNMLSKMRIQQNYYIKSSPSEYFHSYPSFGTDFGVYLYQRIYKWFGIQIGIENSIFTYNYEYEEWKEKEMLYYRSGMLTFPILFNASYYFKGRHGLDISLGFAPLLLFPGGGMGITDIDIEEDGYITSLSNSGRSNFNLYGKIGYDFLFKNKNTLGVAIVGSYAPEPYAEGTYYISNKGTKVEEGKLSLYNTFIGLQFSYGFTMKKLLCDSK